MAFTLAWLESPVPRIPDPDTPPAPRGPDRREHFGSEAAAMRRACELLPGSDWLDLRLYGPDGRLLADQDELGERLRRSETGDAGATGAASGAKR